MKEKFKNIIIFMIPLLIFVFALLVFYPGILSYDSYNQWAQVESGIINDAHPFLTTFFMLVLSKIYNSHIIVLIFQIILFSTIWAYICSFIRKSYPYLKNFKHQIIFTIIMCLIPIYFLYSITLWKDIIYSYLLLLISGLLFIGIKKKFNYKVLELLLLSISLAVATLYRHNAIIVTVLVSVIVIINIIKNKIGYKKIVAFVLLILVSYSVFNLPKTLLLKDSPKEEYSISFPANYSVFALSTFYNNNVKFDKKDKELLQDIIPDEVWRNNYDPYLINTLMFSPEVNKKLIIENSSTIVKMFLKYSFKYPQYFILHYLQADSMLYNPLPFGSLYVFEFSDWNPYYSFDHNTESKLPFMRKITTSYINFTYNKPYILRVLMYRPVYPLILSVFLIIIMIKKKWADKKYFIIITPMLFNTLSLLPINIAQDLRYVYINFLTFPLVLLIFISTIYYHKKS